VRVAVVSVQAPRVRGLMNERKLPEAALATLVGKQRKGGVALVNGALTQGFALPDARLVVLTDAELFGANDKKSPRRRQEFRGGLRLTSLLDLKPGDYVVHIHHGIGQFQGAEETDGARRRKRVPVDGLRGRRQTVRARGPD
jgi:transcription-repair coupling factor (superfamily II helicase)